MKDGLVKFVPYLFFMCFAGGCSNPDVPIILHRMGGETAYTETRANSRDALSFAISDIIENETMVAGIETDLCWNDEDGTVFIEHDCDSLSIDKTFLFAPTDIENWLQESTCDSFGKLPSSETSDLIQWIIYLALLDYDKVLPKAATFHIEIKQLDQWQEILNSALDAILLVEERLVECNELDFRLSHYFRFISFCDSYFAPSCQEFSDFFENISRRTNSELPRIGRIYGPQSLPTKVNPNFTLYSFNAAFAESWILSLHECDSPQIECALYNVDQNNARGIAASLSRQLLVDYLVSDYTSFE